MVNATATGQTGNRMRCSLTHIALHVQDLEACVAFYQAYAGLRRVHERSDGGKRIVWLAERGRERELILVLLPGGPGRAQASGDFSHLGFALDSHAEVDRVAERADLNRDGVFDVKDVVIFEARNMLPHALSAKLLAASKAPRSMR